MARQGPSFLHGAAVPEADTVRFNVERGDELQFPLAFIFPSGGTIWADHPYCILDNADWVSDEQAEAAAGLGIPQGGGAVFVRGHGSGRHCQRQAAVSRSECPTGRPYGATQLY